MILLHYLEVALVFILILSVLVAAHEFGHYMFARLFGMGVEEFSIGMGGSKPLFTYYRRRYRIPISEEEAAKVREMTRESHSDSVTFAKDANVPSALMRLESATDQVSMHLVDGPSGPLLEETTAFTVRPYPVGGFVRIKGMMPQEDGSEVAIPGGFYSKSPGKRFIVLLAGPVFSVLSGVLVLMALFMSLGIMKQSQEPILGTVIVGPASKAGLRTYDRILKINDERIDSFYQIVTSIRESSGSPLTVQYQRGDKVLSTTMTPIMSETPLMDLGPDLEPTGEVSRHYMMGANPIRKLARVSASEAAIYAFKIPVMTVNGLIGAVKNTSTAKSVMGGPGTMIKATSDAVEDGLDSVLTIAAEISISVGIFNLLPIFPLDGGQMAVAVAEMLRGGRRLSIRVQNTVGMVGLATVCLLVCFVLTIDVGKFLKPETPPKVVSQQKAEK